MTEDLRRFRSTGTPTTLLVLVLFLGLAAGLAGRSEAVPAFARQLNTKCQTCHFPAPPRLNNVGLMFKRMGFRLPDADDNGNLVFKTPDVHGPLEFASVVANMELEHDQNPPSATESSTNLRLGEVTLFSAHALPSNLSYWLLFLPRNDEGGTELELGEVQYNFGKPTDSFHLRAGQIQTLWWQQANDEGITLSAPLAFDEASPAAIGSFAGLGLATKQSGVELANSYNRLADGKLTSTVFSVEVLNGLAADGSGTAQRTGDGVDVLAQAYHFFGPSNSIGGFYYRGNAKFNGADSDAVFKDRFERYGVMGSYLIARRLDLVGGLATGKDTSTELDREIKNRGWFVEADVSASEQWSVSYRHDDLDPDTATPGDDVTADTLSTRYRATDNLLFTLEYHSVKTQQREYSVVAQLKLVF